MVSESTRAGRCPRVLRWMSEKGNRWVIGPLLRLWVIGTLLRLVVRIVRTMLMPFRETEQLFPKAGDS